MTSRRPFAALHSRDFRLLWFGNIVSLTGTEMTRAAVSWHILELSNGDPLALGAIGAARLVPLVLLAIGSGVLADTIDRRRLMIGAQIAMMCCSLTLALTTNLGLMGLWLIYGVTALAAAAHTIGLPARQALIPSLVSREHLAGALSLNIVAWQLSTIVGPTIGGLLIEHGGVGLVYWIDTVSFTAILLALLLMQPHPLLSDKRAINLQAAIEGLRFVWRTPLIWSTMLLDFLATFFSAATTLLPIYAQSILQVGPQGLGLLYAAPSVGAVIASIICSIWGAGNWQGPLLIWSVAIYGLSTAIFGLSTNFALSLLMLAINGATDTLSMIVRGNIRNLETPDELRGRMVAVNMLFFAGGPQLGEIEAGVAARLLGTQLSVALGGLACVVMTAIVVAKVPILRSYTNGRPPTPMSAPTAAD
ncbi:MAG: MFS transporter [Chloroflexus sp.]